MSNYIDVIMKRGINKFKREIAAGMLATGLAAGVLAGKEGIAVDKPKITSIDIDKSSDIRENSQIENKKPNIYAQEHKEVKKKSKFPDYQFVHQELDILGAESKVYDPIFKQKEKEYKKNKFGNNIKVEIHYFERVLGDNYQNKKDILFTAAKKYGVPPELLQALCYHESGCQAGSTNKGSGAAGYMQFLPKTARAMGLKVDLKNHIDERRDLKKSADASAKYLAQLYGRFGQWGLALVAYSGGGGKLSRRLREKFPDVFHDRRERQDAKITYKKILSAKNGSYKNSLRKKMRALLAQIKELGSKIVGDLKEGGVNIATLASPQYGNMQNKGSIEYAFKVEIMAQMLYDHEHMTDEEKENILKKYNEKLAKIREKRKRRKANSKRKKKQKKRKLAENSRKQNN